MKSFSFDRELRLLTPSHFNCVFKGSPLRAASPHLTMLAVSNHLGHPRLGFVISRKSAKRAVTRNRVKRVIREYFRLTQHRLPPVDLVIIGKPGLDKLDNEALKKLVERQCHTLQRRYKKSLSD